MLSTASGAGTVSRPGWATSLPFLADDQLACYQLRGDTFVSAGTGLQTVTRVAAAGGFCY